MSTAPPETPRRKTPPPQQDAVTWHGVRIPYTILRDPRRKRSQLRFEDGIVVVRAPLGAAMAYIRKHVLANGEWAQYQLAAHWSQLPKTRRSKTPPPHSDAVEWQGVRVPFIVIRDHRRKRAILQVNRGAVVVRAPLHAPQDRLRRFVHDYGQWVQDRLAADRPQPAPPPQQDAVEWNGAQIPFTIIRHHSRRSTVLRVVKGEVQVRTSLRAKSDGFRAFVLKHAQWVLDLLAKYRAQSGLGYGDTAPYMGRTLPLVVTPSRARRAGVSLHSAACKPRDGHWHADDVDHVHANVPKTADADARGAAVREALIAWYRAQTLALFRRLVPQYIPAVAPGATPTITVSNARSYWGKCFRQRALLHFSWRCMALDWRECEYLAVHELAHLRAGGHGRDFWDIVLGAMPDAKLLQKRMRQRDHALRDA